VFRQGSVTGAIGIGTQLGIGEKGYMLLNSYTHTYIRYGGARPYLKAHHKLKPLCGI
jgi:hypothetical protein